MNIRMLKALCMRFRGWVRVIFRTFWERASPLYSLYRFTFIVAKIWQNWRNRFQWLVGLVAFLSRVFSANSDNIAGDCPVAMGYQVILYLLAFTAFLIPMSSRSASWNLYELGLLLGDNGTSCRWCGRFGCYRWSIRTSRSTSCLLPRLFSWLGFWILDYLRYFYLRWLLLACLC